MAGVFHVEFGINDTLLTRTLEVGDHLTAETLIKDRTVPSYLDEGCYQRTPLYIVLCGLNSEESRVIPRNLYLARLLVEYGANVNYRIPTTYFGCEYMGPGKSGLELLVDFHNDITKNLHGNTCALLWENGGLRQPWDPTQERVIGLDKQLLFNTQDLLEHIEDLIFILLSNGADPNLTDEYRMTCLHRTAIYGQEMSLLKLLADYGANVNAIDCQHNTPLLSLCDTTQSEESDLLEDLSPCSDFNPVEAGKPLLVKTNFLNYFLSRKDVQVNAMNKLCQTTLFHCVIRGDMTACSKLLKGGADASIRGTVWESRRKKRKFSPLFMTFLSIPVQRSLGWSNVGQKLAAAPRLLSHLVDSGHFTTKEIFDELMEIVDRDLPEFSHLRPMGTQLIPLMLGSCTASLKQLATRVIFRQTLIENSAKCLAQLLPSRSLHEQMTEQDLTSLEGYNEHISLILNKTVLQSLLSRLSLPQNSLPNFEAELLLRRLACLIGSCKVIPPCSVYEADSDDSFDVGDSDSSQSAEEGDSDLEYW